MPITNNTELFALRTLNKEQLIKKILELQDDMEDLYDEDGVCMSSAYQELEQENKAMKRDFDILNALTTAIAELFLDDLKKTEEDITDTRKIEVINMMKEFNKGRA